MKQQKKKKKSYATPDEVIMFKLFLIVIYGKHLKYNSIAIKFVHGVVPFFSQQKFSEKTLKSL